MARALTTLALPQELPRRERPASAMRATDWAAVLTPLAATALAIGFAVATGLGYGRGNQWQYLLHGLRLADPQFLAADWFTARTVAHHALFNWLVCAAARSGAPNVALGLANAATSLAAAAALHRLAARLTDRPLAPTAVALTLLLFWPIDGIGHSSLLAPYLAPSSIAVACLLWAVVFYVEGRVAAAGCIAALGGAMHANFWVLTLPLWLWTLVVRRASVRRVEVAWLVAPLGVALLAHATHFVALVRDGAPRDVARRVFFDVYAPMHYRPWTWGARPVADFALALAAGWLALRGRRWQLASPLGAIVSGVALIVTLGAVGTVVWPIDAVAALFPWRFAPLLACASFLAAGLRLCDTAARFGPRQWIISCLICALLIATRLPWTALLLAGLAVVAAQIDAARARSRRAWVAIGTTLVLGLVLLRAGTWRGDAFGAPSKPAERALFAWARDHTPPDALFVTPPDLRPFRLEAQRAVLVDWKCMPLLPTDQLEWLRRHERQAGRPIFGESDADAAYATLDARRAAALADEFGCQYVVIDRRVAQQALDQSERVYRNEWFDVYRVGRARRG
ncbi:MAG: DUF6798 domain-containing protein [Phycisphaerae bacterium]